MKRALLIAGPTASGKSAVALKLAERFGATIVNADAMQVYADLRVLTARPSAAEARRAPHRLFGEVDAAENFSVGRWLGAGARNPRRGARSRRAADLRRRHRPLFPRPDRRPVRHPARARGGARGGARRGRRASDAEPARRARRARSAHRRAAQAERPPARAARARGRRRDRPAAGRISRRARGPRPAGRRMGRPVPRPRARRRSTRASNRASTKCCATARSTKSPRSPRAGSTPPCRRCAPTACRI